MADVSTMTAAQIDAAASTEADKTVTTTARVSFASGSIHFYSATSPVPGIYVTINGSELPSAPTFTARVADIVGPAGSGKALTGAEANALQALLKKLFVYAMQ